MTALARIPHTNDTEQRTNGNSGNHWVELVQPAADLAAMIAATEFVPAEMRNKPAAIAAAILYGAELGLGPMQSLAKIDIVKGRPAPRAELARALALAAGHEIWVDEQSNTRCKVSGRRRGSQQVQTTTWTMDDVRKAGISSTNYARYPRQMLLARASAELVRMMAPDVLGGISLFAEEAADTDIEQTAAGVTEPLVKATTRKRPTPAARTPALTSAPPTTEPAESDLPLLPDEQPPATTSSGPTGPQLKKMMAGFNDIGLTDRNDRHTFTIAAIGRNIASSKDLTIDEAATVIEAIDSIAAGTAEYVMNPDSTFTIQPIDTNDQPTLLD